MGEATRIKGWMAIGGICSLALLIQQLVTTGETLILGLPPWILLFILLQVALTITAAWMAKP
ncbi:hypothetical protein KR52_11445 [Synechococcus sp. KORDI-52]|uniref:hypothetical protein n=1 Tax=Synechococcus sp. KORDI-52 TaxID=585425 RepID=UPI0004E07D53|nr:hypothetical protein [Synechococcus sp. KORDI-52]AII49749.1 hypothetical protein KR52_11445 [Synechococcus sp. KORDI-52]